MSKLACRSEMFKNSIVAIQNSKPVAIISVSGEVGLT